jgi:hypothetical protein
MRLLVFVSVLATWVISALAAPNPCNATAEASGDVYSLAAFNANIHMRFNVSESGSPAGSQLWALSPCSTQQFDDNDDHPCAFAGVNLQQYATNGTCLAAYRWKAPPAAPANSYDETLRRLSIYFVSAAAGDATQVRLLVTCDPNATTPVPISGSVAGSSTVIRFNSSSVCSPIRTTAAPNGPPASTAPVTTRPPSGPTTPAPPPPPNEPPKHDPVSVSVIVGACVLGVAFIAVVCVLRRWAVESKRRSEQYVGVARMVS